MSQLTVPQAIELAQQYHQAGHVAQAQQLCRWVLAGQPNHPDALHLLGVLAGQAGQLDLAVELLQRAVALRSDDALYHSNLGVALSSTGQFDAAIACYHQALRLKPDFPETCNKLGIALENKELLDEAIVYYRQALQLRPDFADAHYNLAHALNAIGQLDEAIVSYRRALHFKPNFAEAHNNLANVLKDRGQLDETIASYRAALQSRPDFVQADSNFVYTLHFHPGFDAREILREHRRWNQQHAAHLTSEIRPHSNDRSPDRRLRIGYVSHNFRDHVVGRNLLPLFREHSHTNFEIFCYSDTPAPDSLTDYFKDHADVWRNIAGLSDSQLADLVRTDQIDILVDLILHLDGSRLLAFARQPAPVQVTFAGYPGTTGLDTIDYRLTDPCLDPPGLFDDCYSEKSLRLPGTFWCYDPRLPEPPVNPLPALAAGAFTFGCLNNFCKTNDQAFHLWARVMNAVPRSRLILLCDHGSHRQRVASLFQADGITPDRVEFVPLKSHQEYLLQYHAIDLGLDTLPYNGHTTSLDSYWMGVPVITLVGQTVVGRAGLSQLTNLGLTELVAYTPDQFVQIASDLAQDLPRLAQLRSILRQRMQNSPLMDAPRFARAIESAYRTMWQRWCANFSPRQ